MGLEIPVLGNMIGSSGQLSQNNGDIAFQRPSHLRLELSYINIKNTTENTLKIYGMSDEVGSASPSYSIGGYMMISLKLNQKLAEGVKITFNNPNPTTNTDVKPLEIIWSEGSLNWGSSLAPSFSSNFTGSSVNVINTPDVHITNNPNVTVSNIPHTVVDSGNIAITNTPTVNIGALDASLFANDYITTPMTSTQNNAISTLTQSGVAGKSWYIGYVNWRVSGGAIGATDVSVQLKDNTTVIYNSLIPKNAVDGTNLSVTFPQPIKITQGNSVTYSIGASGTAGTIIDANIGLFNK